MLIRNAAAIMTGLPGDKARAAGRYPDRCEGAHRSHRHLSPEAGEKVVDATDCVIYPGWINTHHHLAQSVLKGVPQGINLPLLSGSSRCPTGTARRFDAELLSLAAEIGMAS